MKKHGKRWRELQKEEVERKSNIVIGDGSKRLEKEASKIERENKKIHICYHYYREQKEINREEILNFPLEDVRYEWVHYFFYGIKEHYYHAQKKSYLHKISSSECQCANCGQIFPIQKIKQMEQMFDYMNSVIDLKHKQSLDFAQNQNDVLHHVDLIVKRCENIFSISLFDEKILDLFIGIEPVKYRCVHKLEKEIVEICTNPYEWEVAIFGKTLAHNDDIFEIKFDFHKEKQ